MESFDGIIVDSSDLSFKGFGISIRFDILLTFSLRSSNGCWGTCFRDFDSGSTGYLEDSYSLDTVITNRVL